MLRLAVRWRDLLGIDVRGPWISITESIGPVLSMVVESFNAHDDYGDDRLRNGYRATTISQAISRPRNTRGLHARILSLVSETSPCIRSVITRYACIIMLEYFNKLYTFNFLITLNINMWREQIEGNIRLRRE